MSVMLDGKLVFVLNLIGFNWPQADEDKLRDSARHWREYASELEHVMVDSNRILDQIRAENSGQSIDALEQHWRQFGEHLGQAHSAAGLVAEGLDGFALAVEVLKVKVAVQLGILATELAATTGAAILTFGVAEAAAPEEIVVTQGVMGWLSREAIQKAGQLVAEKVGKAVTEHFLTIKNGLKALKASPAALKDFGKGLVKGGTQELEHSTGAAEREGSDALAAVRDVNPTRGTQNCVNCAHATDVTLSGARASALNSVGPQRISKLAEQFGGRFNKVEGRGEIERMLTDAGPGSRGIVFGSRDPFAGHVFNAVNENGIVRFVDGQVGREASFEGFNGFSFLWTNH